MGSMRNNTSARSADEEAAAAPADSLEKSEDDAPRMTRGELAGILRGGASALAKWGTEGEDPFHLFRDATFAESKERGRQRDEQKEVGIKKQVGEAISAEEKKKLEEEEEEAERLLLAGKEAVQARFVLGSQCLRSGRSPRTCTCRKFEGAVHKQSNSDIRRGVFPSVRTVTAPTNASSSQNGTPPSHARRTRAPSSSTATRF